MPARRRPKAPVRTLIDLVRAVERIAPPGLAEDWDNCGLQLGDPNQAIQRVMTCLELTAPTLAEAGRRRADAIVTHHPLLFKPLRQINFAQPAAALAAEAIRRGIGVVAAHTNLDSARWGTNQVLAEACGLTPGAPLAPRDEEALFKFAVYVPAGHEQAVIDAIDAGGGGSIGAYSHCTFRAEGVGTFKGGEGTQPFIGEPGRLEQTPEFRIETIAPASARAKLVRTVRAAHPYEEMAFDLIPLDGAIGAGLGCVTKLPEPATAQALAADIKRRLKPACVRLSGSPSKKIKRAAICSGSGGGLLGRAAAAADVLITGEIGYHQGVEAHQRGLAVIEIGHFESEVLIAGPLAGRLEADAALAEAGVKIFAATADLQPFIYV